MEKSNIKYKLAKVSFLDRLLDENPSQIKESHDNSFFTLESYKMYLQRDLENLLNTRQPLIDWPKPWQELNESLYAYGIMDVTGKFLETKAKKNYFCDMIASVIQRFEPRLKNIRVALKDSAFSIDRVLYLEIEATLLIESTPEIIIFNSLFETEANQFKIINSLYT